MIFSLLSPPHHDSACSGFSSDKLGISLAAESMAAAAMHDGQYSRKLASLIFDNMISVAREIRNPMKVAVGSSLHAKKATKLKGVMDRSLQSKTPSTRSSILRIVLGSKINFVPSTCKSNREGTRGSSILAAKDKQATLKSCIGHPFACGNRREYKNRSK